MPYIGHVKNGVIVLDEPVTLEEGSTVAVEVTGPDDGAGESRRQSRYARYREFIGALDDMPEDWADNHDPYLREHHFAQAGFRPRISTE